MTHPDREVLTQLALNEPLALDAEDLVHIADCDECTAEIAALQRVVTAAGLTREEPDLRDVVAPPPAVWERIASEAGLAGDAEPSRAGVTAISVITADPAPPEPAEPDEPAASATPISRAPAARRRRRVGLQLVAASVVGIIIGAVFTWVITERDDGDGSGGTGNQSTLTTSDLVGVDGHTTSGVASFEETPNGGQVTIELEPEDVSDGFIQAWLLDADTGGMVALGVVDGDKGTFAVPPDLDLNAFNQIDISLEPYDGNPEHSSVSLARGPLP
jgi:hypothetical protein